MVILKTVGWLTLGMSASFNVAFLGGMGDRSTVAQPVPLPTASTTPSQSNPAVPLPDTAVTALLTLANVSRQDVVYSLGSGDGRLAIAAVKTYGVKRSVVVAADNADVQVGATNAKQAGVGDRTQFLQQNLSQISLRDASVVYLDTLPNVSLQLRPKLLNELKPGTRIVARTAALGDWKPDQTTTAAGVSFYYWVVPDRVAGDWQGRLEFAPGRSQPYTLRFTQQFQQVKGDAIADGKKYNIPNITLTGDRLTFNRTESIQGQTGIVQFNGRIEGDTLKGTAGVKWGVLARNFPIVAKRSVQASQR